MNSSSGTIAESNLQLRFKLSSVSELPANQSNINASAVRRIFQTGLTATYSVLLNQPDKQELARLFDRQVGHRYFSCRNLRIQRQDVARYRDGPSRNRRPACDRTFPPG